MPSTDHLRDFFQQDIGRVINYSALEALLNMPQKTLRHWAKSGTRALPDHQREKLLAWARLHGYSETTQYDPII